jgi:hypothetical protein
MVVCPNQEYLPLKVGSELENGPKDCKAFFLRGGVIPLNSVQRPTLKLDRVFVSVRVFLQQVASDLLRQRIGIQNVPSLVLRQCQHRWM